MKIALMNEFSQADKNAMILGALTRSAQRHGAAVYNTAMVRGDQEPRLNYIHLGIQAFLLLNTGAVDFVVTGCGSGEGACMSLNSYPGVNCGYITDPSDAVLFAKINNGNAMALAFAKDFGWASELKLEDIFDKLLSSERGGGYPAHMKAVQNTNSRLFNDVKRCVCKTPTEIVASLDPVLVKTALSPDGFRECFLAGAEQGELRSTVEALLA